MFFLPLSLTFVEPILTTTVRSKKIGRTLEYGRGNLASTDADENFRHTLSFVSGLRTTTGFAPIF